MEEYLSLIKKKGGSLKICFLQRVEVGFSILCHAFPRVAVRKQPVLRVLH